MQMLFSGLRTRIEPNLPTGRSLPRFDGFRREAHHQQIQYIL